MDCPDAESLALETEEVLRHLVVCGDCRAVWLALKRSEPKATWAWKAAAAVLLLAGVAYWRMPKGPAAVPSKPVVVDASWVAPGLRVQGPAKRLSASRWRLDAGEVRIEDRLGGMDLETPAGLVKGIGPWVGRVKIGTKVAWIAEALAADAGDLLVEVEEGRVEVRQGKETLILSAGERLNGERKEAFVPSLRPVRSWKPGILDGGTAGMTFPIPLPGDGPYVVEIHVRPLTPEARVGLVAPVGGSLRLWQASGADCPAGQTRRLVFAVLGQAASGSVEGLRLWTLADAARGLQAAEGESGLRVWGRVEVLEVVVRAP